MTGETGEQARLSPRASRPHMFGGYLESVLLPWKWAAERLTSGRNYWIATTRPDGRPHARPVWAVWFEDVLYFSTGSLAAVNLASNPEVTVHLDLGNDVLIIEGSAEIVGDPPLVRRMVDVYNQKYQWDVDPENLPGPFYAVRPRVAFGWVAGDTGLDGGAMFHGTVTRWKF
jgi:Pyridoxamine 5'-phosphate oxidase